MARSSTVHQSTHSPNGSGPIILDGLEPRLPAGEANGVAELVELLDETCAQIASTIDYSGSLERLSADECWVSSDDAMVAGLIVAEAVTNAIKYSHPTGVPGKITVACLQDRGGGVTIEVTDDGVGLPEKLDPESGGGVGFKMMRALSEKLRAKLTFKSSALGLCVTLRFLNRSEKQALPVPITARPGDLDGAKQNGVFKPDHVVDTAGDCLEVLEALPVAVCMTDAEGAITFFNEAAATLWGRRPALGKDRFCGSWKLYSPDGRPLSRRDYPVALALRQRKAIRGIEAVAERPDGSRIPFIAHPTPRFDDAGALVGAIDTLVDISERKQAQTRYESMAAEVQHRTKNLFAVLQAVVAWSFAGEQTEKAKDIADRLHALAQTQVLLLDKDWQGADLAEIVRSELGPFADRVQAEGPELLLGPKAAQNFALALHELTINAAKYGALSNAAGRIRIAWAISEQKGESLLTFRWQESEGPPVSPPAQRGFGSAVLERVMAEVLDGLSRIDFAREGLTYELNGSLKAVNA